MALYSLTPEMKGQKRPWHIGLLRDYDLESARIMKDFLVQKGECCIGGNEPCVLSSVNDYTVSRHAALHEAPALEIENRQD